MKISLLLPTLGERICELGRLLDSLSKQKYSNYEVVIVSQSHHGMVEALVRSFGVIHDAHIPIDRKGLTHARNIGLRFCTRDIVTLTDDACWYRPATLSLIAQCFANDPELDCLITQIYDYDNHNYYKRYRKKTKVLTSKLELMSVSSIELSFKRACFTKDFDERFGLGSGLYLSCEEGDFLLSNFDKGKKIVYEPIVTVYHPRKPRLKNDSWAFAKGALYAKHANLLISHAVLIRDLLVKHENNYRSFMAGYRHYRENEGRA